MVALTVRSFRDKVDFSYLSNTGNFVALSIVRPQWPIVRAENLNPQILVMQPANQGVRYDASDLLNRARDRRNWSNDRYVLAVL